jgi:hypothetical protein
MSSARSVASARQRRANITESVPPAVLSKQNNPYTNPPSPPTPSMESSSKLTIANAITLITLRLGKIESYIQNLEEHILPQCMESPNPNYKGPVKDDKQLALLLEKVNLLEEMNNQIQKRLDTLDSKFSELEIPKTLDSSELKEEVEKLKDLLLFVQHNSLETNQKLVHFLYNAITPENMDEEEIDLSEEELEGMMDTLKKPNEIEGKEEEEKKEE